MMRSPARQFTIEMTADRSPTLRGLTTALGSSMPESMHHSGGAASETLYIYGTAIQKALSCQSNLNFLVVGTGLGYIEILISSLAQKFKINSYEIESDLRENFLNWVKGSNAFEIYDQVTESFKLKTNNVRQSLNENELILNGELNLSTSFKNKSHVICFDAFSQKTSGSLWTEEFLNYFILNGCAPDCVFVTYACTGLLKRVLTQQGFRVIKRPGFTGKRDSTLALRGHFLRNNADIK